MHHITRRLSPSLVNDAVTAAKIPDRSILQQDEAHPTLRARVAKNGKVSTGDNVEMPRWGHGAAIRRWP